MISKKDIKWFVFWTILITVAFLLDAQIHQFFQSIQTPLLTYIFIGASFIVDVQWGIFILMLFVLIFTNRKVFLGTLVSLLLTALIVYILKSTVPRERPNLELQSFPSGHSSSAFSIANYLERIYSRKYLYIFAAIAAISRVYLGVHYASDVVCGAFLGVLVSELVFRTKVIEKVESYIKITKQ